MTARCSCKDAGDGVGGLVNGIGRHIQVRDGATGLRIDGAFSSTPSCLGAVTKAGAVSRGWCTSKNRMFVSTAAGLMATEAIWCSRAANRVALRDRSPAAGCGAPMRRVLQPPECLTGAWRLHTCGEAPEPFQDGRIVGRNQ